MEVRLLRFPEVSERVGLKRSAIYKRIAAGEFPKGVQLGPRTLAWPSNEIDAWIKERASAPRVALRRPGSKHETASAD